MASVVANRKMLRTTDSGKQNTKTRISLANTPQMIGSSNRSLSGKKLRSGGGTPIAEVSEPDKHGQLANTHKIRG